MVPDDDPKRLEEMRQYGRKEGEHFLELLADMCRPCARRLAQRRAFNTIAWPGLSKQYVEGWMEAYEGMLSEERKKELNP